MTVEPFVQPLVRMDSLTTGETFEDPAHAGKAYERAANNSPDITMTVVPGKIVGVELNSGSIYAWPPDYMVVKRAYKAVPA